ncbi:N-acetyltransferase GCN5 [Planococcus sp. PAMC 21323]|uniref:GNAT family N-acetyltransferase n=1 Tax=Planococcus sp. PAMC 21323 TaxID=1526927 RepID=UPI000585CB5F|nr:GNAT family N-acetyltransferase [Planococcus sp. PAMC 21323]AIY06941.1 N-acetyltransferase GCN5 [Planococcus sp. PAMC 21323]
MTKEDMINDNQNLLIESERCFVRPFIESDLDAFMLYRNDLEWMKFQGFKGLARKDYEEALLKQPVVENGIQLAIIRKTDQTLVGDIFLKKEANTYWIGYTISPLVKRQGYAFEMVNTVIHWVKKQGEFKIKASVALENRASIQLLEKVGFVLLEKEDDEFIYFMPHNLVE